MSLLNNFFRSFLRGTASELSSLENGLAIVVDGNKTAYASGAAIGDYVFVKNSTITDITDGLYKAAKAIPYNTTVDKTYFTACSKGLGGEVASLSDQIANNDIFTLDTSKIQNYVSGTVSYCVKSNICTVSFVALIMSANGNIDGLPRSLAYCTGWLTNLLLPSTLIQTVPNGDSLIVNMQTVNEAMYGSISYPVKS